MTIPASQLVDILSRTIGGGLSGIELNGVLLTKNSNLPVGNVLIAYSAKDVSDYFGADSDEYAQSAVYFKSDDNKQKVPSALYFYRAVTDDAVGAYIRGGSFTGTLADLKAITNGSLKMKIDGGDVTADSIDFSEAVSLSSAATILQAALDAKLSGVTVEYNALFGAFVIHSPTTGAESKVDFAEASGTGTDLGVTLNLTSEGLAVLSQGSAVKTFAETLNELTEEFQNFFGIATVWQETVDEALPIATWVNQQGTRFGYFYTETSAAALVANNSACFAKVTADFKGIHCCYNTKEYTVFEMSIPASTDYSRTRGRKVAAFRSQGGLAATVSNGTQAQTLLNNGYNFYGAYATASEDFTMSYNGQISGAARWLDTYAGQVWLKFALQAAWLSCMKANNTLPFNDDGYGAIRAASLDPIEQGVNAGVIVKGVTLSQEQKNTVNTEAGEDISEPLYTQGWFLKIPDASAQVRADRGPLKPSFWYCDGGSIQRIVGNSNTIL